MEVIMLIFTLAAGISFGIMFHYLQKDPRRKMPFNIILGLIGALAGYGFSMVIPMLPEYRNPASVLIICVISTHFMGLAWMLARRRKPIIRHVDRTHLGETHF